MRQDFLTPKFFVAATSLPSASSPACSTVAWMTSRYAKVRSAICYSADAIQERLRSHAQAFDGLLSLIPAKYYYGDDNSVRAL